MVNTFIVLILEIKILDNWKKDHQIILEKILFYAELPDNRDIQKKKFSLLAELFLKLCNNKNSKSRFKNVSSLILLFLNFYKKNYPIDIYSRLRNRNSEIEKEISEIQRKLKQELQSTNPIL